MMKCIGEDNRFTAFAWSDDGVNLNSFRFGKKAGLLWKQDERIHKKVVSQFILTATYL